MSEGTQMLLTGAFFGGSIVAIIMLKVLEHEYRRATEALRSAIALIEELSAEEPSP